MESKEKRKPGPVPQYPAVLSRTVITDRMKRELDRLANADNVAISVLVRSAIDKLIASRV